MKLPYKGSKLGLIASSAEDRFFQFFLCCFATFASVVFSFLTPQIVRFTIDSIIGREPLDTFAFLESIINWVGIEVFRTYIWLCGLLVLLASFFSGIFNVIRRYTSIELGETIAWRVRNTAYGHIQKLPFDWHVGCQTGDIIQRCTTDVDTIRNFIHNHLSELMRTICVLILALVMMFSMDVFMSFVSLSLIPVIIIFSIVYFKKVSVEFARADAAEGVMQAASQENYTGVRVVRAFGREKYEMDKFAEKSNAFMEIWVHIGKMLGFFWGAGDLFTGLQLAVIVGAGVLRSVQGNLTPGTFLAFYAYCNMMIWPIRQLGRILSELSRALVASGRVMDILSVQHEIDTPDALKPDIKGEIVFENVTFKYGNEAVLRDVSFKIKPGESLAILGATGSGKSTLVNLISRLYDLEESSPSIESSPSAESGPSQKGVIFIDGIDIRRISRSHLRRHIGLCLQEPFLFSKTIRENISLARPDMELSEVQEAAATAMVDETIEGFAQGYDTLIGERGVTVSGGQKQRLAIARMLAGKPPVMIFDDSLSAVDTDTDAKIRAALRCRTAEAAVIIISHRISSLMQADKILVLKDGTVEDIGSHEELLERGGSYSRIFELQRGLAEEG